MRSTVTNESPAFSAIGLGLVEQARRLRRHVDLAGALAFDLGLLGEVGFDRRGGPRANRRLRTRSGWPRGLPDRRAGLSEYGLESSRWWPSRSASIWALCRKPAHAFGVFFLVSLLNPFLYAPVERRAEERTLRRSILQAIWGWIGRAARPQAPCDFRLSGP